MTIALFSDSYLPTKSGVVTVVLQLRNQLIKQGHRVLLITVETTQEYSTDDPDIYRVRSMPLGLGTDQFIAVPLLPRLLRYMKENHVDLIHCHTEFGVARASLYCARKLKIPAICTTHTMWTDFYKYYLPMGQLISPKLIIKYLKSFYGKFNSLIGVSTKARNFFKQKNILPNMPSVIIPNAIDESKFQQKHLTVEERQKFRTKYGIAEDDVLFLFIGRIGEEKRVLELLGICKRIVSKNEHCKVMFVGNGPAYSEMTELSEKEIYEGKIIFTGFVEWAMVHNFYESADIFITASLSEMHSMTVLEAELSSLPLIVRQDESYLDSIVNGENGYTCATDEEMEKRALELASDKEKRKAFGKKSFEISNQFSIENHIKRTLFVYNEVIKAYPKKINDEDVMKRMAEYLASESAKKYI
ncbi:MAG: glycosyltransferase [Treponema sp.]|nr:glycosyltransferase [Spirochaetia bacterium]MDD7460236.1 glycosyltransferase [Spirochaetales bacterium]MDY5810787.1 glycosyltransferase [Treponema sp.]MEE1182147.1 glycosyltransferase [Treponema sp.]